MPNKRYFKENMEDTKIELNKKDYEPIRHNSFIFKHPLMPSYIIKSVCDFGGFLNVEMYYPESFDFNEILKCKKEAYDCELNILNHSGEIIHTFEFKNCIAENISLNKFDYEDDKFVKICILFKYST